MNSISLIWVKANATRNGPKRQGRAKAITYAHAIKLEALRLLGTMLKQTPKNEGALRRGSKTEPRDDTPTLADLGLDKKTSMLAQRVAKLSEEKFIGGTA